jgi:hypothetical protein
MQPVDRCWLRARAAGARLIPKLQKVRLVSKQERSANIARCDADPPSGEKEGACDVAVWSRFDFPEGANPGLPLRE